MARAAKRRYYLHRNTTFVDNYFGRVGPEFEVCWLRYIIYRIFRWRFTVRDASGKAVQVERSRRDQIERINQEGGA